MEKIWIHMSLTKKNFKKLDECKPNDEEETEINSEDAISLAYDLSEYGDNMINRIIQKETSDSKVIQRNELKEKLEAIIEENEEGEGEDENYEYKPLTQAQLAAYERLLKKLDKDTQKVDPKTEQEDETSTVLYSLSSNISQKSQSYYSLRKIKDYLQKKAKEAKKIELENKDKEAMEMVKILEKKSQNKIKSSFNPLLDIKSIPDGNYIF